MNIYLWCETLNVTDKIGHQPYGVKLNRPSVTAYEQGYLPSAWTRIGSFHRRQSKDEGQIDTWCNRTCFNWRSPYCCPELWGIYPHSLHIHFFWSSQSESSCLDKDFCLFLCIKCHSNRSIFSIQISQLYLIILVT